MPKKYTQDFPKLAGLVTYNSFGFFFLDFIIPFIAVELLHISGTEMGLLFSLRIVGYFFSSSFVGLLADTYSRRNLLIIGSTGRGIAYFIMYGAIAAINLPWLLVSNLILGFMAGFFWIPFDALIADKSAKENRSQAYGIRTSAQGTGVFIGASIGFFILWSFEPNTLLMYSGIPIFGLANFYASWKAYKVITNEKIESIDTPSQIQTIPTTNSVASPRKMYAGIVLLAFVIFLEAINGSLAKPFIIPYFLNNFTNSISITSFVYIPVGLVSILLAPKLGKLVDKVNIYVGVSICSLIGALVTYLLINTSSIITFSILLTVDEMIVITISLILSNVFSRISIKHRGKLIGSNIFFTNFGGIIGPITGGILWQYYSDKMPFIVSIGVELLVIPFIILSILLLTPYFEEKIYTKGSISEVPA